jgi:hypothetical protein
LILGKQFTANSEGAPSTSSDGQVTDFSNPLCIIRHPALNPTPYYILTNIADKLRCVVEVKRNCILSDTHYFERFADEYASIEARRQSYIIGPQKPR